MSQSRNNEDENGHFAMEEQELFDDCKPGTSIAESDKLSECNKEEEPIRVLSEDHPLLQKFQQSLKAHLLKVKQELTNEILEIDYKIHENEKEREDVGERLYDLQQQICNQNSVLDEFGSHFKKVNEQRISYEKCVEISRKEYSDVLALEKESKRKHNERLLELGSLQALENNIRKWSKEIEDEVVAAKRIVSKDSQDQQAVSVEKKKMDLLIFNLDTEVRKKEQELEGINGQLSEQSVSLETLQKSLSDATADLEALQQEQKRLTQSWGEVIISIQHRDRILQHIKEDVLSEESKYKLLCANVDGSKKEANKEMELNEKLVAFQSRVQNDIQNLNKQLKKQESLVAKLDHQLEEIQAITQETEKDFQFAKQEGNALQVKLRAVQNKLDKEAQKRFKVERKILQLMQDQITADKASEYRMKLLREDQDSRRKSDLSVSESEKAVSEVLLDIEKWKLLLAKMKDENEHLIKIMEDREKEKNHICDEIKAMEHSARLKIKQVEALAKNLDLLIKSTGGESTPIDLKITALQKSINEIQQQTKNAQQLWLTRQEHLVNLTEKRSTQLHEIQIARKQMMVIEQKSLKTNAELSGAMKQGQELTKTITKFTAKLDILGVQFYEKKKNHEVEEEECHFAHFQLMDKLKEAEMNVLHEEQEIVDLNKEIDELKQIVLELHREALSWETKYKMTEETARWRRNERENEGEIGNMETEIRRMEVRYSQLKRAQNKLVQDLEACVMRRENIFFGAMARQKLDGSQSRSKSTVQHKLNEVKNKLKLVNNEIVASEKSLADVNERYENLVQEICNKQSEIENEKMQDKLIQVEIEEGMLMKHKNLENIVRKQHRAKRYRALSCYKSLPKQKSEQNIDKDMSKQMEINDNLSDIANQLLNGYPDRKFHIKRILQTLKDD